MASTYMRIKWLASVCTILLSNHAYSIEAGPTSTGAQSPAVVVYPNAKSSISYNIGAKSKVADMLAAARNFQNGKNQKKMLEFASKAYAEDKKFPGVVYTYALALVLNKQDGKARELLIENQHRLDESEKALLAILELNLKHYESCAGLLKGVDLSRLPGVIEAQAITSYAVCSLETMPYQEALGNVQNAIMLIDRKKKFYGKDDLHPIILRNNRSLELKISLYDVIRLDSVKFKIAFALINKVNANKDWGNIANIIRLANEGFSRIFGHISDVQLYEYLRWFNDVARTNPAFVKEKAKLIDDGFGVYIQAFSNGNDTQDRPEKQRVKMLANLIADSYGVSIRKYDIEVTQPIELSINQTFEDESGVKSVIINATIGTYSVMETAVDQGNSKNVVVSKRLVIPVGTYTKDQSYLVSAIATDRPGNVSNSKILPAIAFIAESM